MSREPPHPCIFDACSIINLAVMPCGERLVARLGWTCHVPQQVLDEVVGPRRPHQRERELLLRHMAVVTLEHEPELRTFEDLVSREGSRNLGDGEAAALALARSRGLLVVTDDGPAMQAGAQELSLRQHTSVGLLRHAVEVELIGGADVQEAINGGLCEARMAIHDGDLAWAARVVGDEALCRFPHLGDVRARLASTKR